MPLPASVSTIPVHIKILTPAGNPAIGSVYFRIPYPLRDVSGNVIVGPSSFAATLDSNGEATLSLPATDDPDITPQGWTYSVRVDTDAWSDKFEIEVPVATVGTLEFSDITPAISPSAGSTYLPFTGGTVTGALTVNAVSATDSVPLGRTGATNKGLNIRSSFAGGEDDGTGTDTTGRINLYSYQRAQNGSFGENIRHFIMRSDAKSMDAWYLPTAGYSDATELPDESSGWTPVVWTGAHWKANDQLSVHGHWAVEVPSQTNGLTTRLEIPFIDQEDPPAPGEQIYVQTTNIRTHDADFTVSADSGVLRVGGGDGVNKDILLSHSSQRSPLGERWKIRGTSTAEAGSNVGTDLTIRRYSDAGAYISDALFIKRATGNISIGETVATGVEPTTSAARVQINWSGNSTHGILVKPSATPGNAAGFATSMSATTDRSLEARVTGDATSRFVIFTDGKTEWGDGASRDTNLYRDSPNVLRTDDSFIVGGTLRHVGGAVAFFNAASVAKQAVSGSRGGNAALASLLTALATYGLVTDSTTA